MSRFWRQPKKGQIGSSKHGWPEDFIPRTGWSRKGRWRDEYDCGGFEDPHHGMPYPATIALRHVLWIVRDERQDLAFRNGLGIVTDIQGGHEEMVRLA